MFGNLQKKLENHCCSLLITKEVGEEVEPDYDKHCIAFDWSAVSQELRFFQYMRNYNPNENIAEVVGEPVSQEWSKYKFAVSLELIQTHIPHQPY